MAAGVVIVAGAVADVVLWPRDGLPAVAPLAQHDYFTTAFIARAADFRGTQSVLALLAMVLLLALPMICALLWPRGRVADDRTGWSSRWLDRREGVPFGRGGATVGAIVAAFVAAAAMLVTLPLDFVMFLRARSVGLVVQAPLGWLGDWLLTALLSLLGIAVLALLAGVLIRRLGRTWWLAFGVVLAMFATALTLLSPILIEPLFADFSPLRAGQLRGEVDAIARASGVRAGDVYLVDAARRTTGANAYVSGLGSTKRVVIYDTLLNDFTPAERRQVIAHEFGHARYRDVATGLVWFAFVAFAALFAIDLTARMLAARRGVAFDSPAAMVMLLASALFAIALSQPAVNAWSRAIEARADAFALEVTRDPDAAVSMERRLTVRNVARPEPPAALQLVLGTHPTPMQRIGMAVTVRQELRPHARR